MWGLTDMIKNEGNNRDTMTQDQKEIRRAARARPLLDKKIISFSLKQSILRLNPRIQLRNPVMFVVEVGAILVSLVSLFNLFTGHVLLFPIQIAIWLWFTVIFANVAEAMAEGRGKAQAESLRQTKVDTQAKLIDKSGEIRIVKATDLRKGDIVLVTAGDIIPADGTVEEGVASIDESAITGESAPVIRESGGDKSGVTGGTRVLSDSIRVKVSVDPGESFMDRMVDLVESAERQKTPNEIALTILILGLTLSVHGCCRHSCCVCIVHENRSKYRCSYLASCLSYTNDNRGASECYRYCGDGSFTCQKCRSKKWSCG